MCTVHGGFLECTHHQPIGLGMWFPANDHIQIYTTMCTHSCRQSKLGTLQSAFKNGETEILRA